MDNANQSLIEDIKTAIAKASFLAGGLPGQSERNRRAKQSIQDHLSAALAELRSFSATRNP